MKSLVLVVGVAASVTVFAAEKRISESQLPAAVKSTAQREAQGAEVLGYATEVEKGRKLYEVELSKDGKSRDVTMDTKGNVVEVEEEVAMDQLPAAVREGLKKKAGKGQIKKVESLTKADKLVAYEAQIVRGGKRVEVQVGPNGETLAHPE